MGRPATPSPAVHSVHIYEKDSELIERLSSIYSAGLRAGNYALVIATPEHGDALAQALWVAGINLSDHIRAGRYRMFDVSQTLAAFMVDGKPDTGRFGSIMSNLLGKTRATADAQERTLTVFGEMVAVLWESGNKAAALQLEAMWNDALHGRSFHLHCAYPRNILADRRDVAAVCEPHSHVVSSAA